MSGCIFSDPHRGRACPDIGTRPAEGIGSLAKSWPGSAQWDRQSRDYRQLDELQGFLTEQARISCGHAEIESAIGEQQEVLLKGSTTPSCSDDAFGQSFATSSGEGTPSWCSPTRRTMEAASVIVAQAPEALQSLITLSWGEPFSRGGADLRPVKVNPTRSSADGDAALDEEKVRRFGENRWLADGPYAVPHGYHNRLSMERQRPSYGVSIDDAASRPSTSLKSTAPAGAPCRWSIMLDYMTNSWKYIDLYRDNVYLTALASRRGVKKPRRPFFAA